MPVSDPGNRAAEDESGEVVAVVCLAMSGEPDAEARPEGSSPGEPAMEDPRPPAPASPVRSPARLAGSCKSFSQRRRSDRAAAASGWPARRSTKDLRSATSRGWDTVRRSAAAAEERPSEPSGSNASFSRPWAARAGPPCAEAWSSASESAAVRLATGSAGPAEAGAGARRGCAAARIPDPAVALSTQTQRISVKVRRIFRLDQLYHNLGNRPGTLGSALDGNGPSPFWAQWSWSKAWWLMGPRT
jgi:hypothetical protein